LYDAFPFEGDLPFYRELAQAEGGRVLELACGSGRVLLPLVGSGYDVVGIDVSPHMLAVARGKLASNHKSGRGRLVEADMRDFALGETGFDLAIVAVKSFAYLTTRDDQLRALERIAAHLRPGGVLTMDLMHPRLDWLAASDGSMKDDLLHRVASGNYTLSRVESVVSTDLAQQLRVIRSIYERIDDSGAVIEKRFVEWPYRWTYRFEAEHLLERAGFAIEAVYGGYRREPFTSSSGAMVFVARKSA
jgi:SAM-dependent methyltransferase